MILQEAQELGRAGLYLHYRRDPRCTPAGYALIAAEVARYLEARDMVP